MIHDNIEVEVSIVVRDMGGYPAKVLAGNKQIQSGSMTFADMRILVGATVEEVNQRVQEALAGAQEDESAKELEF
jgi:hypothetical protein